MTVPDQIDIESSFREQFKSLMENQFEVLNIVYLYLLVGSFIFIVHFIEFILIKFCFIIIPSINEHKTM